MQLANFFWILLIATGGFFLFFSVSIGYMLRKERKDKKRTAALLPAVQTPEPILAVREFVVSQEQPVYYNSAESQPYPSTYPVQYPGSYQSSYPVQYPAQENYYRTQENYVRTQENNAPQPVSVRRTSPRETYSGRSTHEQQQRFVIVNSSPEIRFR